MELVCDVIIGVFNDDHRPIPHTALNLLKFDSRAISQPRFLHANEKEQKRFLIYFHTSVHTTYVSHDMQIDSRQNLNLLELFLSFSYFI